MNRWLRLALWLVALQAIAWFLAAATGYGFGTHEYGTFASIAALVWLGISALICMEVE